MPFHGLSLMLFETVPPSGGSWRVFFFRLDQVQSFGLIHLQLGPGPIIWTDSFSVRTRSNHLGWFICGKLGPKWVESPLSAMKCCEMRRNVFGSWNATSWPEMQWDGMKWIKMQPKHIQCHQTAKYKEKHTRCYESDRDGIKGYGQSRNGCIIIETTPKGLNHPKTHERAWNGIKCYRSQSNSTKQHERQ